MKAMAADHGQLMACPKCGDECGRDEVDVGPGFMYGPYGCGSCGWSEDPDYDLSDGQSGTLDGGTVDQWGRWTPPNESAR